MWDQEDTQEIDPKEIEEMLLSERRLHAERRRLKRRTAIRNFVGNVRRKIREMKGNKTC